MTLEMTPAHYPSFDGNKQEEKEEKYWAKKPKDKVVSELVSRANEYYVFLDTVGRRGVMRRSWIFYNMAVVIAAAITSSGAKGQYAMQYVNEYRSLLTKWFQLVIATKPSWSPKAMTNDSKALAEVILAKNALDSIKKEFGLDSKVYRAVEQAGTVAEGWITVAWNTKAGRKIDPTNPEDIQTYLDMAQRSKFTPEQILAKKDLYAGDFEFYACSGIDVIRDPNAQNIDESNWIIVRDYPNKFDLAAKYTEQADKIIAMQDMSQSVPYQQFRNYFRTPYKTDRVVRYRFLHKATPAMPNGREIYYLDSNIILEDTPLGYSEIPAYRIVPGETEGTSVGYTPAFDCLSSQDALNKLLSQVMTMFKNYGLLNIAVPVGTRINESKIPEGMNMFETVGTTEFQVLNFLEIKPEFFNLINYYLQRMLNQLGLEPTEGSGSAQALQLSQSQKYSQGFQASYETAFENLGSMILEIFTEYGDVPRKIQYTGEDNVAYLREISKKSFTKIHSVEADISDGMENTAQGRFQMADLYVRAGNADNQELFEILATGKLGPGFEVGTSQQITIAAENEALMKGEEVSVVPTDDNFEHLRLHGKSWADALSTPEARAASLVPGSEEEKRSNAYDAHCKKHIAALSGGQPQQPGANPYALLTSAMGYQTPQQPAGAELQGSQTGQQGGKPTKGEGTPGEAPAGVPGAPTKGPGPGAMKGQPPQPSFKTNAIPAPGAGQ